MKKRIMALTLTAVLALSSTTAFAATTNCTSVNYNNLLKNQYKITVNGKVVNLNSIDWKTVLKKYSIEEKANQAQKPVAQAQKPAAPAQKPAAPVTKPITPAKPHRLRLHLLNRHRLRLQLSRLQQHRLNNQSTG